MTTHFTFWYFHNLITVPERSIVERATREGYTVNNGWEALRKLDEMGDLSRRNVMSFIDERIPENIELGEN